FRRRSDRQTKAFTSLVEAVCSSLYSANYPSHDRIDGVPFLGFSTQSMVCESHGGDILRARKLARRVGQVADVRWDQVADFRRFGERKSRRPVVLDHLEGQLRKQAATSAQEDARRQPIAARQLLQAQSQALQEHLRIGAEEL